MFREKSVLIKSYTITDHVLSLAQGLQLPPQHTSCTMPQKPVRVLGVAGRLMERRGCYDGLHGQQALGGGVSPQRVPSANKPVKAGHTQPGWGSRGAAGEPVRVLTPATAPPPALSQSIQATSQHPLARHWHTCTPCPLKGPRRGMHSRAVGLRGR